MEMTIDKAIPKIQFVRNALNDDMEIAKAYDLVIDTMRKYQQIKNIICKWEDGIYDDEGLCHTEVLEMISDEVNGDGNVD